MSFLDELKRRNVFKVGVAYAIVAWLLIQVASIVVPAYQAPDWVMPILITLISIGFPIAVFLAWAYELTPEGIKPSKTIAPSDSITHVTGQKLNYIVTGLLVLVVAVVVIDNYVLKEDRSQKSAGSIEGTSDTTTEDRQKNSNQGQVTNDITENSIAVLPFTNMSSDPEQEYFADGIAEELLNALARIKDLEVRGRTSSFSFKGSKEDLRTISDMLNVAHILEGSVRKAGDQVRITVQLIHARTDAHLWSETYERTMEDIFAIQDDIARSVANALQITLGVGELGRVPGMTRNVGAYEAFLSGRSLMNQLSRENVSRAIARLEQAVALDPEFAMCWNALIGVYNAAAFTFIPERAEEFIAKSDTARTRVVELVPEADYALRIKAEQSGDRVEIERLWKQALAQDPTDFDTNLGYGSFLASVGRPRESIDYRQSAIRVEPLAALAHLQLGVAYELSGNSTAAAAAFKQGAALADQPAVLNSGLLVLALEENNRALIDEYVALVLNTELLGNINRTETRDINEVMHGLMDTPEAAGAELQKFISDPAYANPFNRSGIVVWASYFGEHELALQTYQEEGITGWVIWRPIHKPMRRLPGFKELVRKAGLVDYWRRSSNWGDFCRPVGEDDFECE